MAQHFLITGATGFVGGHLAEACAARGHSVSTIARPASDTLLLERAGVTIHRGDLTDPQAVRRALDGVDVVVHCAAKVGDRGPVEEYRAINVDGTRHLLQACRDRPLRRFIHMSTLGVYQARHHYGTDETEPLPARHIDGYTQTKVEAEHVVMDYYRKHQLPVVILRPGFVYGPRDRTVLPELIKRLAAGQVHYLGGERRALNTIYVGNLVDAVFLAVDKPRAVGQAFNLTDGEHVTKRRFFEAVADSLGLPKPHQRLPRWFAALAVLFLRWEARWAKLIGKKPWLSPAEHKFLLLNLDFSIEKARRELGYRPRFTFDQAMRETMAWYRQNA